MRLGQQVVAHPLMMVCSSWSFTRKRQHSSIKRRINWSWLRNCSTCLSVASPNSSISKTIIKLFSPYTISIGRLKTQSRISRIHYGRSWTVTSCRRQETDSPIPSRRSWLENTTRTQCLKNCRRRSWPSSSRSRWSSNWRAAQLQTGIGRNLWSWRARSSKSTSRQWHWNKCSHSNFRSMQK